MNFARDVLEQIDAERTALASELARDGTRREWRFGESPTRGAAGGDAARARSRAATW